MWGILGVWNLGPKHLKLQIGKDFTSFVLAVFINYNPLLHSLGPQLARGLDGSYAVSMTPAFPNLCCRTTCCPLQANNHWIIQHLLPIEIEWRPSEDICSRSLTLLAAQLVSSAWRLGGPEVEGRTRAFTFSSRDCKIIGTQAPAVIIPPRRRLWFCPIVLWYLLFRPIYSD